MKAPIFKNFEEADAWGMERDAVWKKVSQEARRRKLDETERARLMCIILLGERVRYFRQFRVGKSPFIYTWDGRKMWNSDGEREYMSLEYAEKHYTEIT